MYANRRNSRALKEIGVEKHDGDVRSGNIALSFMRHNYRRTVRSLWTWLWGRYHVPQNIFLVIVIIIIYSLKLIN